MPKINLTRVTEVNDTAQLVTQINAITNNWIGNIILFGLWTILFIAFRQRGFLTGFSAASYITAVAGILLRALGLVSDTIFWLFVVLAAVSIVMVIFQKQ